MTAFDAADGGQAANLRDIGGLGRPGRDRAGAGSNDLHQAFHRRGSAARAISEQLAENVAFGGRKRRSGVDHVNEFRADGPDRKVGRDEVRKELLQAKLGEGR